MFSVDTVMINFNKLPKVDLFASAFAGGASGYPHMYDNFQEKEQILISEKNRKFLLKKKTLMLREISPKYFLPYAGFFVNKLSRDNKIQTNNRKNNISDYHETCSEIKTEILNVESNDQFYFQNKKLVKKSKNPTKYYNDLPAENYLNYFKESYSKIDIKYIKEYFSQSNFKDELTLLVSLVDSNFVNSELDFQVDFNQEIPEFKKLENIDVKNIQLDTKNRILYLKCRKESF